MRLINSVRREILQLALGRAEQSARPVPGLRGGLGGAAGSPGARWWTRRLGIFAAPRCAPAGSGTGCTGGRGNGGDGGGATCMSSVTCHRTLVGSKPHKTGARTPSAEQRRLLAAPEPGAERRGQASPRWHLKFALVQPQRSGVQPNRINSRCAGYVRGRRGRVRSLCSPEARSNLLKPRSAEKRGGGVRGWEGARGGRAHFPSPQLGRSRARERLLSARRWPLGRSHAPDWLTFQCHSGGVSTASSSPLPHTPPPPQLRGAGDRGENPARRSSAVRPSLLTRAPSPATAPAPLAPPGTLGITCSPGTGHHLLTLHSPGYPAQKFSSYLYPSRILMFCSLMF